MNKIRLMKWLATKRLKPWPSTQWPQSEGSLLQEMLLHQTIDHSPWDIKAEEVEAWSQLSWGKRLWERKRRKKMEILERVLWYGILLQDSELPNDREMPSDEIKERLLLEAQKWESIRGNRCIFECIDFNQNTIDGQSSESIKDKIQHYKQKSWWYRLLHRKEGNEIKKLEELWSFFTLHQLIKNPQIEDLNLLRAEHMKPNKIKNYEEEFLNSQSEALIKKLVSCKNAMQKNHVIPTKSNLNWEKFLKKWAPFTNALAVEVQTFQKKLVLYQHYKIFITADIYQTLEKMVKELNELHAKQRIDFWQSYLEKNLNEQINYFKRDFFYLIDSKKNNMKSLLSSGNNEYYSFFRRLKKQVSTTLQEVPLEDAEIMQIWKSFEKFVVKHVSQVVTLCGEYVLNHCKATRDIKDSHEFKRYEEWVEDLQKQRLLDALYECKAQQEALRLIEFKPHHTSIVLYQGNERLENEWERIYNSFLIPECSEQIMEARITFRYDDRKKLIDEHLKWVSGQFHRLSLHFHPDHSHADGSCFRALKQWVEEQGEVAANIFIPTPNDWLLACLPQNKDSMYYDPYDFKICREQAEDSEYKKQLDKWANEIIEKHKNALEEERKKEEEESRIRTKQQEEMNDQLNNLVQENEAFAEKVKSLRAANVMMNEKQDKLKIEYDELFRKLTAEQEEQQGALQAPPIAEGYFKKKSKCLSHGKVSKNSLFYRGPIKELDPPKKKSLAIRGSI